MRGSEASDTAAAATLRGAAATASGERRIVTALCYDLVGSTDLLAQSDVEEFDELIQAFQRCARQSIFSGGGSLREVGDGGVALFPVEIEPKDAASLAINAGLEIVDACARVGRENRRSDLHVRVGISTSIGLVRAAPERPTPDNVTSLALAMAARLQAAARPDTVLVSQQTRFLARRSHVFSFQGVQQLKGIVEPEKTWRALNHRLDVGRFYAFGKLGVPTIGRGAEVRDMIDCWQSAARGEGAVLLIEGEAGIGKSRLLHEIRRATRGERSRMFLFQCWPGGSYSTLHPLRQSFSAATAEGHGRLTASAVARLFRDHGVEDAEVIDVFAFLLGAEGVDGRLLAASSSELEDLTGEAVRRGLELISAAGPVIIAVEDVHWIDPTSQRLLREVAEVIHRYPALLVLTARGDAAEEFRHARNLRQVRLGRLDATGTRDAIIAMWPRERASDLPNLIEVLDRITAGVPLFIEEICHWMAENADLAIERIAHAPSSAGASILERVLSARIEPLGPAREVVRAAAVAGLRSNLAVLREMTPNLDEETVAGALDQLIDAGLLTKVRTPGEVAFAFRHALIQETLYGALLRTARQGLHRRLFVAVERQREIAPWIATDALADHAEKAGMIEPAIVHYVAAGKDSSARSSIAEARHLLGRAVALCGQLADAERRDVLKLSAFAALGPVLTSTEGSGSKVARDLYEEGVELARRRPASERATLFPIYWGWWFTGTDLENARARAILDELGGVEDPEVQLQIRHCIWAVDFYLARHDSCLAAIETGLPLYAADRDRQNSMLYGGHDARVCGLAHRALSLWLTGRPASALRSASEARSWALRTEHVPSIAHALINQAALDSFRRDFQALRLIVPEIRRLADEHRLRSLAATLEILEGWGEGNTGDLDRGVEMIRRALATHAERETPEDYPVWCGMLAELLERTGDFSGGLDLLSSAEAQAEKNGHRYWLADLCHRRARLLYGQGGDDEAMCVALARSLEIAAGQNAVPFLIGAYETLLRLGIAPEIALRYRERVESAKAGIEPGEPIFVNVEAPPAMRLAVSPVC